MDKTKITTPIGRQLASDVLAKELRMMFPQATDVDFGAVATKAVEKLDLAAVAYVDQRFEAFERAIEGMMEYDSIIRRNLHEQIATLKAEVVSCNTRLAQSVRRETPVAS